MSRINFFFTPLVDPFLIPDHGPDPGPTDPDRLDTVLGQERLGIILHCFGAKCQSAQLTTDPLLPAFANFAIYSPSYEKRKLVGR